MKFDDTLIYSYRVMNAKWRSYRRYVYNESLNNTVRILLAHILLQHLWLFVLLIFITHKNPANSLVFGP